MTAPTTALSALPSDWRSATLLGRAWIPGNRGGPSPSTVRPDGTVIDLAANCPTVSVFLEWDDVAGTVRTAATTATGRAIGTIEALLSNSRPDYDDAKPRLLAPCDLQAIKAAGVTFIASTLERVIEEHARGSPVSSATISPRCARDRKRRRASSRCWWSKEHGRSISRLASGPTPRSS